MTVPSSTARDQQVGNGTTTAFTVPFRILADTHLRVLFTVGSTTTEKVLTTDYTVTRGAAATTVTFLSAPSASTTITFLRRTAKTQETDYVPNDPFPAESHETGLDKLTMVVQELDAIAGEDGRTIKIPAQVSGVSTTMQVPAPLVLWGWDAAGTAPRNYSMSEIVTSVAFANFRYNTFTATAGQDEFTLSADPGGLGNLDVSIDGVTQVPAVDYTYVGTTLTLTTPLAGGEVVSVRFGTAAPSLDAVGVTYTPAGGAAVQRLVQDKLRDEVAPEDFGAVGDGLTDDTQAWQDAVDSGAKRVRGRQGAIYLINGQRAEWHPEDLHRLGLVPAGVASFSAGYWYGVRVPSLVRIENAHFYITKGADTTKAFHAFAFGDPDSVTRSKRNTVTGCTFEVYEDFGGGSKRPRCFVAQSVDGFKFFDNKLIGFDEDNGLIGGYLFDCFNADLSDNEADYAELLFVTEFCTGVRCNDNLMFDCSNMIDVDKACANFTICDNIYNRSAQAGVGTVDGVIEINGIDGLVCTGNVINYARAPIQYSAKGGVADSWAAALAGTAVATYYPPKSIISRNVITNCDYYAIRVGGQWDSYDHDGVPGASNVTISDTIVNAYIQGGSAAGEAAAILVNECDGFVFDGSIDGSGAHGIMMRTSLEADHAGAGTWSVLKARIGGMIRNCEYRGFRAEAMNEIVFDGLYVTDCGDGGSVMVETRSLHEKPAKLRGRLTIERGDSTATIGWIISGGDAGTWDASTFDVLMDSVVVKGDFDPTDGIRLSAQGASTVSALPIIFRSAIIDKPDTPYFTEDGSRTNAGTPVGALTPRYIGERVFDTTNDDWYIGTDTSAATDWQAF